MTQTLSKAERRRKARIAVEAILEIKADIDRRESDLKRLKSELEERRSELREATRQLEQMTDDAAVSLPFSIPRISNVTIVRLDCDGEIEILTAPFLERD